jgi:tetratricopeptide (TPR) repeat protein
MGRKRMTPQEAPGCVQMHVYRAFSGKTQPEFSDGLGIEVGTLGQYETFLVEPGPEKVADGAKLANLSLEFGDTMIRLAEIDRRQRLREGGPAGDLLEGHADSLHFLAEQAWKLLLTLEMPEKLPCEEDRQRAKEQLPLLEAYTPAQRAVVVRLDDEHQPWALCLEAGEASVAAASQDAEEAGKLARLSREFAEEVKSPQGWPEAIRSRALACEANAFRAPGNLKEARKRFDEANRLAEAGADPYGLLDPGKLPDLEASLCRDERDFENALRLLDKAVAIGWSPARSLINKGFTLEVMGDYEGSAEALRAAGARLDREAEPRLWYKQRAQLASTLTQIGRHSEAAELIEAARPVAMELGDKIDLIRLTWVEGRIQVGLGHRAAARFLLEQAQARFAKEGMAYDVCLAAMEIAGLMLDEGKSAEVKAMTLELAEAFESEKVHHEARKALDLFRKAAEREAATAELARRVLSFLFRSQHDPALRFSS